MNLNIVSVQEQFNIACEQARANEHARIGMLCKLEEFQALTMDLKEGDVFDVRSRRVTFKNGASIKYLPYTVDTLHEAGGIMLTTLFVGQEMHYRVVECMRTRMRSSKFKDKLKTYYPYGLVMWEEWEQYGSTE